MQYDLREINLNSGNGNTKVITLAHNYSFITIKKIVIPSHYGNHNWVKEVNRSNLKLLINLKGTNNITSNYAVSFLSLIEPNSVQPVFETFIEIPKEHANSPTSFGNYYKEIELILSTGENSETEFEVVLLCSSSPGVVF